MKTTTSTKALYSGIIFVTIGAVFIFLENSLYQFIDDSGRLHESLFLPLGAICLVIGSLILLVFIILKVRDKL